MTSFSTCTTALRRLATGLFASCAIASVTTTAGSTAVAAESSGTAPTLLVLGDSISAGYGLQTGAGWVDLLRERLRQQHYDYSIVNASISGETTIGGRTRIDELVSRVKPSIVIVELGGNDALRGLSLDAMQKNLEAIVARARDAHADVLIVGMQIPPNYGRSYGDRFAAAFAATARQYKTALTPFFFAGFADRNELFQPDGIHPTAAAQVRLLDNVWPALQPLLKRR